MNNVKWEDGAVCFAYGGQMLAVGESLRDSKDYTASWGVALEAGDFQLNGIREGDYIEASELGTEQKYNNAVEVFELFGFELYEKAGGFRNLEFGSGVFVSGSGVMNFYGGRNEGRMLTYSQLMAIGKLKRAMLDREKSAPKITPDLTPDVERKTATDYLQECMQVQKQRGEQYDSKGTGERSFAAIAEAFTAITGKKLVGSDIALIQQILKDVRQYADPTRFHEDSGLDKVSYASLHAEELRKELL